MLDTISVPRATYLEGMGKEGIALDGAIFAQLAATELVIHEDANFEDIIEGLLDFFKTRSRCGFTSTGSSVKIVPAMLHTNNKLPTTNPHHPHASTATSIAGR